MKVNITEYGEDHKVDVQIDKFDIWNMDYTLSCVILPLLKEYKENSCGYFGVYLSDLPEELHEKVREEHNEFSTPDSKDYAYSQTAWNWVVDEFIWAFTQIVKEEDNVEEELYKIEDHDLRYKKLREYHERINHALELFGKYFRALWD